VTRGPFDQTDPSLPAVVLAYHRERRAFVDSMCRGEGVVSPGYTAARAALEAEVAARGGRWAVGRLVYAADPRGLTAEQAPGTVPEGDTARLAGRKADEARRRAAELRAKLAAAEGREGGPR
jgi:nucleotide-binding universal stress UspA family protein